MLILLLIIVFIIYAIHISIHGTTKGKIVNRIPGPPVLPIIGNGLDIMKGGIELFYGIRRCASKYRTISRYWIFSESFITIFDPEDAEVVLSSSKNITKGFTYDFIRPWLKDGLLTSTGDKWHHRRKILTPAFHFNILRRFCTVLIEQSDLIVEKMRKEVGKDETIIIPYITEFTLHSICETAMGTNMNSASSAQTYKKAIYEMGETAVQRFAKPLYYIPFFFNLSNVGKKQKEVINTLHTFTTDVIRERRKERNISGDKFVTENFEDEEIVGSKKKLAMLDLLLSAETDSKISEDGIREEVDTFMFEGHDTTTMAITFCLMCLANHPEIQDKIVEELEEIFADPQKPITIDELNKMRYLERCIKEALRLYPSVPYISRQITEDVQLKNFMMPAGTTYDLHIYDLHRNPDYYQNPLKFDPDRFLPENTVNRHPYAYIPFSAGPRNCIGQKFAMLEEKAVISAILRNFKLEAVTRPDDIIFTVDMVLRSINPVKVKLIERRKK